MITCSQVIFSSYTSYLLSRSYSYQFLHSAIQWYKTPSCEISIEHLPGNKDEIESFGSGLLYAVVSSAKQKSTQPESIFHPFKTNSFKSSQIFLIFHFSFSILNWEYEKYKKWKSKKKAPFLNSTYVKATNRERNEELNKEDVRNKAKRHWGKGNVRWWNNWYICQSGLNLCREKLGHEQVCETNKKNPWHGKDKWTTTF